MAKKMEGSFDGDRVGLDLEQLVDRFELLVDLSRRLGVALSERADHGLDLRTGDVRVNTDAADASELQEGQDEVVVPRIQIELGLVDDAPRLDEVVIRLFDGSNGRNPRELDHRLGLDVDHDAARDVVDDDRPVADVGDGPKVLDDPAGGRLVVVRSDDEEPVDADVVRLTRQVDGVSGGVRAGVGDNGAAPAERIDRDAEQLEPLVVGEGGTLPRRGGDDEPIGTTLDEVLREFAEALEVDGSVAPERRDGRG